VYLPTSSMQHIHIWSVRGIYFYTTAIMAFSSIVRTTKGCTAQPT
jgi:hypothetical protein